MCTRFEYAPCEKQLSPVEEHFGRTVREELSEFPTNLDVRPTQRTPIIRWLTKERPSVVSARWGFIPKLVPDNAVDLTFQADVKLVQTDVMWRYAWRYARCLIPATAWYEAVTAADELFGRTPTDLLWNTSSQSSLKVTEASGQIMMLAGLHGFFTTEHGHRETVSIVTHLIENDSFQQQIPCVVGRTAWKKWLSPSTTDPNIVADCLEMPKILFGAPAHA